MSFETDENCKFSFTDTAETDAGIYSKQVAEKDPAVLVASGGIDTNVWFVSDASFSETSVSLLFELKGR